MQVIILRGIPGCGKSTYAKNMFPEAVVVSADNFFLKEGVYHFNGSDLPKAHQACWLAFYEAVQRKEPLIVVDNTNTAVADIASYVLPAEANGYTVKILTLVCESAIAASRNIHGVPLGSVERIQKKLNEETILIPPRWTHETIQT